MPGAGDAPANIDDPEKTDFAKARKHLIAQRRMVDGTGKNLEDLDPFKICVCGGQGFVIYTLEQIEARHKRHIENRRRSQRKRETESC